MRKLFNWDKFPDPRTFGRVFELFNHKHCNELHKAEQIAREKVWSKKWFGRATLDLDSSVIGVYGSPEGADKGFNPKKKGQNSYHPLLCFVAETRECLHSLVLKLARLTQEMARRILSENVFLVCQNVFGR